MRYEQAMRYLYGLAPRGVQLGLGRMQKALALRGHPEQSFRSIVVAGTNGKGSVSSMLASALHASGHKVGLFTSPHLHQLVERFRVNGRPISKAEFARRVTELVPFLESEETPELTFFEVCTLLAMEAFRDHGCTWAVCEVGLGGRLDATNVLTPEVSVITKIALDHADRLGPTLTHIAREKAGIIKRGVPLVLGSREAEVRRTVLARARRMASEVHCLGREFSVERVGETYRVFAPGLAVDRLRLPLAGGYQADNLACAVAALALLSARGEALSLKAIRQGIARVRWPGRLELVSGAPSLLFDAAHNPDACVELAAHLARVREQYSKIVLLFGVMADKEYASMLGLLLPHVEACVFATPSTPRALPASSLSARWGGEAIDDPEKALRKAKRLAGKRGLVVVAGSIFLMAQARASVLGLASDPPIAM